VHIGYKNSVKFSKNSRIQYGDMKQVPLYESTDIRRHCIKFSLRRPGTRDVCSTV